MKLYELKSVFNPEGSLGIEDHLRQGNTIDLIIVSS